MFLVIRIQISVILFFILLLISKIHSQYANIEISDSSIIVFKDNLIFDSKSLNMTYEITIQEYYGKLCVGNNNKTINICLETFEGYSRQWIILVNETSYIDSLPDFINSDKYQRIKAVIANNATIDKSKLITQQFNFPLFWSNNMTFQQIAFYNILVENDNYFTKVSYVGKYTELLTDVSYYMIVSLLITAIIMVLIWHYLLNRYKNFFPENTQTIQCFLKYLSYLKALVLLFCLYYYNMDEIISTDPNSETTHAYIRLFIRLFDSINISLFWFFLILIANGWYVYKVTFNRVQFLATIIGFIIFYIFFCLDIILDYLVNKKIIINLTISDLKNIVLYSIFIELCRKFSFKTIQALKVKYTYAYYYSREFLEPLKQKVLIVKWHLLICIVYWLLTVINLALLKPLIKNDKLLQLIWCYIEIFTFVFVLILYRPRNFTRFYFVYTNDGSEDYSKIQTENVYVFKCNYEQLEDEDYSFNMVISNEKFSKQEIHIIKQTNNYPIIVIEPSILTIISVGRCKIN